MDACHIILLLIVATSILILFFTITRNIQQEKVSDKLIDEIAKAEAEELTLTELAQRLRDRGIGK